MSPRGTVSAPECLIQCCGADCGQCDTFKRFLAGDASRLVNPQTGYRCCWLPVDYSEGRDCPIKACCRQKGIPFCGECNQLHQCERMQAFYAQPGYDAFRKRMLEVVRTRKKNDEDSVPEVKWR